MRRAIPLAEQLMQEIVTEISNGGMIQENGRLPSETKLSQQYGVSRATVRDALARLESAGVVIRRHGVGTFLSEPLRARPGMIWGWLDEAPAFEDLISQSGYEARCHLLSTGTMPAAEVAGHLNISPDEMAVTIEKRFTADETPIIYSWTALAKGLVDEHNEFSSIPRDAFQQSIYEFLQQYCQYNVSYQTSEVHAIEADETMAEQLACDEGAPLLEVAEIGYSEEGVPLFYATHCFRGDRVSFRLIRIPTFTVQPTESRRTRF